MVSRPVKLSSRGELVRNESSNDSQEIMESILQISIFIAAIGALIELTRADVLVQPGYHHSLSDPRDSEPIDQFSQFAPYPQQFQLLNPYQGYDEESVLRSAWLPHVYPHMVPAGIGGLHGGKFFSLGPLGLNSFKLGGLGGVGGLAPFLLSPNQPQYMAEHPQFQRSTDRQQSPSSERKGRNSTDPSQPELVMAPNPSIKKSKDKHSSPKSSSGSKQNGKFTGMAPGKKSDYDTVGSSLLDPLGPMDGANKMSSPEGQPPSHMPYGNGGPTSPTFGSPDSRMKSSDPENTGAPYDQFGANQRGPVSPSDKPKNFDPRPGPQGRYDPQNNFGNSNFMNPVGGPRSSMGYPSMSPYGDSRLGSPMGMGGPHQQSYPQGGNRPGPRPGPRPIPLPGPRLGQNQRGSMPNSQPFAQQSGPSQGPYQGAYTPQGWNPMTGAPSRNGAPSSGNRPGYPNYSGYNNYPNVPRANPTAPNSIGSPNQKVGTNRNTPLGYRMNMPYGPDARPFPEFFESRGYGYPLGGYDQLPMASQGFPGDIDSLLYGPQQSLYY